MRTTGQLLTVEVAFYLVLYLRLICVSDVLHVAPPVVENRIGKKLVNPNYKCNKLRL
jgi:hypothetical protein